MIVMQLAIPALDRVSIGDIEDIHLIALQGFRNVGVWVHVGIEVEIGRGYELWTPAAARHEYH